MIAKIGKGSNMYGAILYNQQKVETENGAVLLLNKIPDTVDGRYSTQYFNKCFEPYLSANIKTEKTVRHISLNPDPADKVSDEQFTDMAQEYMERMGYGNQPYIVFKHTDIDRTHIHIVSTCVGIDGKKIPDDYDHPHSMAICRDLEQKYNLQKATEQEQKQANKVFKPVNYKNGDIKSQIASVVRHLPKYYSFSTIGSYNALLSLFNITTEEIKGERNGQPVNGLVYVALDENGNKVSNPFKASLFGKDAGITQLQKHFEQSKEKMKINPARSVLKNAMELAIHTTNNETDFKKQLVELGINTIVRKNESGRIYGITFIDHESRSVWNGSQLDRDLSANVFNEWWNNGNKPELKIQDSPVSNTNTLESQPTKDLFEFISQKHSHNFDMGMFSLLPNAQGEDYEEEQFANQMKKKRKKGRRM
ncbi:relaxase/mobilization nuclease domain-containing protein [Myroides marinus]|uniref:conjugal transfer protein MobB n=1 Tax=Bacteroidota TaxID=976 RepID=UPI000BFC0696|nr:MULTISPECIES: conjugal transfer protein MobB [Bacteroidota]ATN06654.1 relaxase [Chryseobacterium indologenes]MDM1347405.1 relaxase/mobilization nuclease domain-containing protein [Myroides marinus]MDM1353732.1 relaxase/mobilization nuclease domain-containing protein [Myroides marinus]MDM1364640.1 relaxase/mobilization nuclease domain-containing protein [Myroides marinus]MDM1370838.1 relaxase/mobilization nuclease domain-containing protein [Myroides marinus]